MKKYDKKQFISAKKESDEIIMNSNESLKKIIENSSKSSKNSQSEVKKLSLEVKKKAKLTIENPQKIGLFKDDHIRINLDETNKRNEAKSSDF